MEVEAELDTDKEKDCSSGGNLQNPLHPGVLIDGRQRLPLGVSRVFNNFDFQLHRVESSHGVTIFTLNPPETLLVVTTEVGVPTSTEVIPFSPTDPVISRYHNPIKITFIDNTESHQKILASKMRMGSFPIHDDSLIGAGFDPDRSISITHRTGPESRVLPVP